MTTIRPSAVPADPPADCPLCPRLAAFRDEQRAAHPDWWNAPIPVWGDPAAWLGIVGLAPGKHGANRTGRPFTGDAAGKLLYATLQRFDLARGDYDARPDDGLALHGAIIVNAVRCLPPANLPTPEEARTCRPFLGSALAAHPGLRVLVALGGLAHDAVVALAGWRKSAARFGHGAEHRLPSGLVLVDSYHCTIRNQNTGLLTPAMFEAVFARALSLRDAVQPGGTSP